MNKICVFIRGAPRTWNYVKTQFFKKLEGIYNDIDYYVCFADGNTVTEQSVRDDFVRRNLICFHSIQNYQSPKNIHDPRSWQGFGQHYFKMAWYDYILGMEKRQHEIRTGIKYRLCMYTRPDLFLTGKDVEYKELNEQDCCGIIDKNLLFYSNSELPSNDIQFFMGPRAADIFNCRFYDTEFTDGLKNQAIHGDHQNIVYYLLKNFITFHSGTGFLGGEMIRPNAIEYLKNNTDNAYTQRKHFEQFNKEWQSLSFDEKRTWCDRYNISARDYFRP